MISREFDLAKWYSDVGADDLVAASPVDKFAEKKSQDLVNQDTVMTNTKLAQPEKKIPSIAQAATLAATLAENAATLADLEKAVREFDGLLIKKTANKTVFAEGNPKAKIMLVGEAPGANEDMEGRPFCGVSGKLMDEMFAAIGHSRAKNLYITNTIFWRPPGNRRPTPDELAICKPFVEKHVALVNPDLLVMVGSTAAEALKGDKSAMSGQRGKFSKYSNRFLERVIPAMVIFHPSYLLRQPSQKKLAWQDLIKIKHFIEGKIHNI